LARAKGRSADRLNGAARLDCCSTGITSAAGASASSRDGRRFDRRAPPAPAARQAALGPIGCARCILRSSSTRSTSSTPVLHHAASSPAPARTSTRRSAEASAPCAGPSTAARNEFAFEVLSRYKDPGEAEADIMRRLRGRRSSSLRPPRLHNGRSAQQGDQGSRAAPLASRRDTKLFNIAEAIEQGDCGGKRRCSASLAV